uniref:Uncharacterized protein n=1 Tax=Magallana gigas TaxID=29159 RepID=K1R177_MAGGI
MAETSLMEKYNLMSTIAEIPTAPYAFTSSGYKPSNPNITGDLKVEVNKYVTLTCVSQSTSAPNYYSKLVTLSYTWVVNDTKMDGETSETLRLYVTRTIKYNKYSCTATEEGLESERSGPSGMDIKVDVAVPIIANPPPRTSDFMWDGPVPVSVRTTISKGNVTYKHLIDSSIPVKNHDYYGNYTLTYVGKTIATISIQVEDIPQTPLNFTGYSFTNRYINLTWISGFNGGQDQLFIVSLNEGSTWRVVGKLADTGEGAKMQFDHGPLTPGKEYWFQLRSCNKINCSAVPANVKAVVKDDPSLTGVLLGMCILSALFGITGLLVAALIIFKTRRKNRHKKDANGVQNVQLEELEEQNMTQHYDDVLGTGVERGYTTVGPSDQETPYEELNSI